MRCATWPCLLALLAWLASPPVHAESVEERAKVPSSTLRLRGASGISVIPGGYISAGGSRLQILEAGNRHVGVALPVKGRDAVRFAAQISVRPPNGKITRGLLRFRFGGQPQFQQLSESSTSHYPHSLLTRSDEFVEVLQGEDRSLTMTRTPVAGEETRTTIPPWTDARGRREKGWFESIGERADGSLWLHWADHLVFVRGDQPPRKVDISDVLGRGTEWAVRHHRADGAPAGWDLPAFPHTDRDSTADLAVHGMGQRQSGGFWLHWGDHLVLLDDGPPRAYSLVSLLPRQGEWASADRYEAAPEKLVIGVDRGAGRDFVSVDLATAEKRARVWGTRHGAR